MLQVYHSNKVERLVDVLSENVATLRRAAGPRGIFEEVHVVVPNWNLETYLKFQIAARQGIAAHFTFHVLERFLATVLPTELREDVAIVDETMVQKLIVDVLSDDVFLSHPELAPVKRYLEPGRGRDVAAATSARDRRRFQLSNQLGKLFREYDYARREMLKGWSTGCVIESEAFRPVELWQRRIWLEIFGKEGRLARLGRARGERYMRLTDLYDAVDPSGLELPRQTHFFGFSYLARSIEGILYKLGAQEQPVCLYSLNPCQEFWEDMRIGNADEEDDIEAMRGGEGLLRPEVDTPALRLWGRPGRDCHRMMSRLSDFAQVDAFEDLEARTLLEAVQRDILLRAPQRRRATRDAVYDDKSLQFIPSPSLWREVETIATEIWALIKADPGLRFNEIAVIVNNANKESYQTQIRAVFNAIGAIPHHIVDLAGTAHSRVFEAVDLLFSLPFGNFRRREFLQLITHSNVLANFPGIDGGQWLDWCRDLHIIHGADHDDHAGTYIEADLLNWQQGMRRLVLGAFMTDAERREVSEPFIVGPAAYLPMEHAQTDLHASARLNLLVQSLISDARFLKTEVLSLKAWAEIMGEMIRIYIGAVDAGDSFDLMKCHELLGKLADGDLSEEPMGFRMAWEFARAELEALDSKRGQYLADGVVVSSFLPMRPIPFKVVFITGMGEGKFPATERVNPLDLRQAGWKEGDVRHREQEKYMFLETLISTRDRLYLSWVNRDGRTGEPLEASSVVRELKYILEGFEGPAGLGARTREPPLRRYEVEHPMGDVSTEAPAPSDDGLARSFALTVHREAFEEARVSRLGEHLRRTCETLEVPFPTAEEIRRDPQSVLHVLLASPLRLHGVRTLKAEPPRPGEERTRWVLSTWHLRRFLECPLQASAALKIGLGEADEEDLFALENEFFETPGMLRTRILREVFERTLGDLGGKGAVAEVYRQRATILELRGVLPTGVFGRAEQHRHLEALNLWRRNLAMAGFDEGAAPVGLRFGRSSSLGQRDGLLDPPVLEVEVAPGARVEVEIVGPTQLLSADWGTSMTLVARGHLRERDFLAGFFDHVLLAATGARSKPEAWRVFVNPVRELARSKREAQKAMGEIAPMSEVEARAYLTGLVEDMLGEVHDYLMPIEAVVKFAGNDYRGMGHILEELLGKRGATSSEYGPVRRLSAFAPLGDVEARRVVEKRYGPLLPLLGGR